MPVYDYQCSGCAAHFSRRQRIADYGTESVKCPECGAESVERVLSAAYPRTARKS